MVTLKALGWGILGWLACYVFEMAFGFAFLGALMAFSDAGEPLLKWWNGAGFHQKLIVAVVYSIPALALGVAIRKRRRSFVVGWFLPLVVRALQLAYYWIRFSLYGEG